MRFRDNLVADVACSLVRCLVDFLTTLWFFTAGEYEKARPSIRRDRGPTSPILTCLPYWFRLQQCVRRFYDAKRGSRERVEHVVNAGKYVVSLVAICLASAGGYDADPGPLPGRPGRIGLGVLPGARHGVRVPVGRRHGLGAGGDRDAGFSKREARGRDTGLAAPGRAMGVHARTRVQRESAYAGHSSAPPGAWLGQSR